MFRALIVEDSVMVRKILARQLKKFHCSVDEANNRIEAIQKFNAHHYDIIFLDNHMPDIDNPALAGLLTAEYIRQTSPTILIVSISSDLFKLKDAYRALGIAHFLGKEITKHDLIPLFEQLNFNKADKFALLPETNRLKTAAPDDGDRLMSIKPSPGI